MVNTKIRLIIFFAAKDGEALYSQQKQDQELTGSDHELLITKFRLKLKKVGKTTRPFKYNLNQIPNDYTVEVRNRLLLSFYLDFRAERRQAHMSSPFSNHKSMQLHFFIPKAFSKNKLTY